MFNEVKSLIASAPVLDHPNFENPFIIEMDASKFATEAVILKVGDDGAEYPIFFSN